MSAFVATKHSIEEFARQINSAASTRHGLTNQELDYQLKRLQPEASLWTKIFGSIKDESAREALKSNLSSSIEVVSIQIFHNQREIVLEARSTECRDECIVSAVVAVQLPKSVSLLLKRKNQRIFKMALPNRIRINKHNLPGPIRLVLPPVIRDAIDSTPDGLVNPETTEMSQFDILTSDNVLASDFVRSLNRSTRANELDKLFRLSLGFPNYWLPGDHVEVSLRSGLLSESDLKDLVEVTKHVLDILESRKLIL